jgi:hypothetical protein
MSGSMLSLTMQQQLALPMIQHLKVERSSRKLGQQMFTSLEKIFCVSTP